MTTPAYSITYSITWDRITNDFACVVDGELIGYARNYADGETKCRAHISAVVEHDARLKPYEEVCGCGHVGIRCGNLCADCWAKEPEPLFWLEHDARLEPVAHPLVWAEPTGIPRCCGGQGCVACGYEAGAACNVAPLVTTAWTDDGSSIGNDDQPF